MKQLFIPLMLILVTFVSCSSKSDSIEKEEHSGIAKYHLTIRDQDLDWINDGTNEDDDFWLEQSEVGQGGVFSLTISMGQQDARQVQFSVFTDLDLRKREIKKTYQLKSPYIIMDEEQMDCFNNPTGCIGIGNGHVSGTIPTEPAGTKGQDNVLHADSGTLTLTNIRIIEEDGQTIKGTLSGTFNFSGKNTSYPAKPNPGKASGSFENAPFEILK